MFDLTMRNNDSPSDCAPAANIQARRATRVTFLVSGWALATWAPMVPYLKQRLSLDEATLGLVLLALGAGSVTAMPVVGALTHRIGYRRVILAGGMLSCFALPLLGWASATMALTGALFGFGLALGAVDVAMNAHAVEVEQHEGSALMSGFHGAFSIGGLLGAGGMSAMLALHVPLEVAATITAVCLALALASQRGALLTKQQTTEPATAAAFRLPDALLWLIGLLCAASFLAEGAMLDWSAVFLRDVRNIPSSISGLGYAFFSVTMAVGRLTGDRVVARFGPVPTVRLGAPIAAAGLLVIITTHGMALNLFGFALVGLGASNLVPVMFSAVGRLPGRIPAVSLATVTALGYAGMLCGPALIGFLAHATSLGFALAMVAVLLLGVGLSASVVRARAP